MKISYGSQVDYSFAVMGDRSGFALNGVFENALGLLKNLKPDFVLSVGDLIEGYWTDMEPAHQEWDQIDWFIHRMGLPFYRTIGNHDCGNELMRNVWRNRYGLEYYAFRYHNSLFLVLNTEDPPIPVDEKHIPFLRAMKALLGSNPLAAEEEIQAYFAGVAETADREPQSSPPRSFIGEAQADFVQKTLESNQDVDWTFVVMHRPLWKMDDPSYARLQKLLQARPHTLFAGHLHRFGITDILGNSLIQMGRTGACRHKKGLDDFHHVLWVSVHNGKPDFTVIKLDDIVNDSREA